MSSVKVTHSVDFWCPILYIRSGSQHCILTASKKLSKLKNQQLLDPSEKCVHRTNHCPQYWGDRQEATQDHNLPEQKSPHASIEKPKL